MTAIDYNTLNQITIFELMLIINTIECPLINVDGMITGKSSLGPSQ
jgi:hypothetical protein